MSEYKKLSILSFILGLVLLGAFSPLIHSSLMAHKNPSMNIRVLNGETGLYEDVPCPLGQRIVMALLFCVPSVAMWILGPIVALAVTSMTDRGVDFITRRQ